MTATAIGSYLEATLAVPADRELSSYEALTGWVESELETNLGDIGVTTSVSTHNLVKTGTIKKVLAYSDAGQTSLALLYDAQDPLQNLLRAANADRVSVTFRENLNLGGTETKTYFQGVVSSSVRVPSDGTSAVMQNFTIDISGLFTA